jgi:hypothetical protein
VIISPFEEDLALYLKKIEFPSPKDNLYQVWLNLACWFWRRRFKKFFSVFLLFRYYISLERSNHLCLNKLKSPTPKDDLCQVCLKLAQWFWRRRFLNDPTTFLHFCNDLLFEEDLTFYLNKIEFPLPKDNLYQVWLNLAGWFWRRRFKKKFSVFLHFRYYSPWRRAIPFIWTNLKPLPPRWSVPSLVKIVLVVPEKKLKM